MTNKYKTPYPWYGAKSKHLKYILPLIPQHDYYAELFGGSGCILFNKPPSKVEIFNDTNNNIYIFWKVATTQPDALIHRLSQLIHHAQLFEEMKDCLKNCTNDLDRAVAFYYVIHLTPNALTRPTWNGKIQYSVVTNHARKIANLSTKIQHFIQRAQNVQFLNMDWKQLYNKIIQRPEWHQLGFIYLDPPYPHPTRNDARAYATEMSDDQHQDLIDTIKNSPVKILISTYKNPIYDQLLSHGWHIKEYTVTSTSSPYRTHRTEALYYNYTLDI